MSTNPNTVQAPNKRTPEQEKLRFELLTQQLKANGFHSQGTATRHDIFAKLQAPQEPFSKDFQPTLAQINDKAFGRENWQAVSTGEVVPANDPNQQISDEVADWQNTKCAIFVRDPIMASAHHLPASYEIANLADAQF